MGNVEIENVTKIFGNFKATDNISLTIKDKEFMCLVGPSGCGKSTTLNMIAGLEVPTVGKIHIDDNVVAYSGEIIVQPHKRDIAMVFQSYALYPHLSVRQNLTFGLNLASIPRSASLVALLLNISALVFFQILFMITVPIIWAPLFGLAFGIMGFPDNPIYYEPLIYFIEFALLIVFLMSASLRIPVTNGLLSLFRFIAPIDELITIKEDINKKADNIAKMLSIENILHKKPSQLSGGQQQRVSLGRAIIREPKVFLLDEPLSNLDARLRTSMRAEIAALQRKLGVTTVYVTHDQVEALTMADRIAVMKEGRIHQVGTPEEIYNTPKNLFVATFLGSPPINIFQQVKKKEDNLYEVAGIPLRLTDIQKDLLLQQTKKEYIAGVRSENLIVSLTPKEGLGKGTVEVIEQLGSESLVHLIIGDNGSSESETVKTKVIAKVPPLYAVDIGSDIYIGVKEGFVHFFEKESELRIF